MNKKLVIKLIIGLFFVAILGSLSHFFYEWSGNNTFVAFFSPVNESIWEHMKLIFFPMLLYTWYLTEKYPGNEQILMAMLSGTLFGTFLIPIFYYTYSGILGFHISFVDISTFFISVLTAFCRVYCALLSGNITQKKETQKQCLASSNFFSKLLCCVCRGCRIFLLKKNQLIGITILMCILFFVFTFKHPDFAIFAEP